MTPTLKAKHLQALGQEQLIPNVSKQSYKPKELRIYPFLKQVVSKHPTLMSEYQPKEHQSKSHYKETNHQRIKLLSHI